MKESGQEHGQVFDNSARGAWRRVRRFRRGGHAEKTHAQRESHRPLRCSARRVQHALPATRPTTNRPSKTSSALNDIPFQNLESGTENTDIGYQLTVRLSAFIASSPRNSGSRNSARWCPLPDADMDFGDGDGFVPAKVSLGYSRWRADVLGHRHLAHQRKVRIVRARSATCSPAPSASSSRKSTASPPRPAVPRAIRRNRCTASASPGTSTRSIRSAANTSSSAMLGQANRTGDRRHDGDRPGPRSSVSDRSPRDIHGILLNVVLRAARLQRPAGSHDMLLAAGRRRAHRQCLRRHTRGGISQNPGP